MDLIQSLWLSTVAGAGLFAGAGYVAGKGLSSKAADSGTAGLLQAEKDARQQAEARAAALEQQHAALTQSLESERSRAQEAQTARTEAQKLREQLAQLQAELNKARSAAAGPSPAEAQLRQENADLRQRVSAAEQASHAYASEHARAQDLEQRLAAAMAQAGAAQGNDAQRRDLEQRLAAAMGQIDQLRAGAQRAEQLAAENAQLRARPAAGGSDKLGAELATEKAKVTQLQNQVTALQKATENTGKLAADLTTEKTKVRDLELKLTAAQKGSGDSAKLAQDLAAEKAKVQQLQAQIATLQQAANEAARLGLDLANARSKINELEAKVAKGPMAGGANSQEVDRLRAESNTLRGEIDLLKRTAIPQKDHDALKKTNNEMALRVRTLEQRASETDYYANENSDLRRRVEELEAIALEAKQMRRRITDLEAQAFAISAAKKDNRAAGKQGTPQAAAAAASGELRLEQQLEDAMNTLVREETGGRVAVLSDTRGLLLASVGEQKYSNELAAAASVVAEVAEKVRALLPFADPQTLHLSDGNNVIVKTRWLRLEDDTLALSVLGFSDDLPDPIEDKAAKTVAKLMSYG